MKTTVSSRIRLACLSTLITFCGTGLSINAIAQERPVTISDAECTTLYNDDIQLSEQSIAERIACHRRSVNRIDWLITTLQNERSVLTSKLNSVDTSRIEQEHQEAILKLRGELKQSNDARQELLQAHKRSNKASASEISELKKQIQLATTENNSNLKTIENDRAQKNEEIRNAKRLQFNLTTKVRQLVGKLQQSKEQQTQLEQKQTALLQQLESTRTNLLSFEESNTELGQKIEKVEDQNARLHKELDESESRFRSSEDQLSYALEQQRAMQEELNLAVKEYEEVSRVLETWQKTIEVDQLTSTTTLKRFKSEALKKQLMINRLEEQRSQLIAESRQLAADAMERESFLKAELTTSMADLGAANSNYSALIETHETTISALRDRLSSRDQRIAEFQTQQSQLNDQLESLKLSTSNNTQLVNQLTILEQKIATLEATETQLTNELANQSESTASNVAALVQEANNSSQTIERLTSQIGKLKNELSVVQSRLKIKSAAFASAESSRLKLEQDTEATLNQFNKRTLEDSQKISQLERKLAQSKTEEKEMVAALQVQNDQLKTLQTQIDAAQSELSLAETENSKMAQQVVALNTGLSDANDLLQQSQDSVAASLGQMRKELRAADERLADKKNALAALLDEKQANANAMVAHESASKLLTESIKSKLLIAGLSSATVELQADQTIAIRVGSNSLFRLGSSLLTEDGSNILQSVGSSIADIDDRRIVIEGHSDNTPLGAKLEKRFVDNWGLSMARAVSTAHFLSRNAGISANLLSVTGLGDTAPIADNASVQGRQLNRRVEILLIDTKSH